MADIRKYIQNNLLDPLKLYPTAIQDTMIELITDRLEELYNYTLLFPEIVTPTKTRLDILKVIADQFLFTIRDEADLQEQIDILTNILYVYNRRGSIDTIENMWKYYGGDLPKDVTVVIPSYNLFRWNISSYSGSDVFQDGEINRTGIYEIKLTNSNYPIPELKKFLLKELVAAGNLIYFSNAVTTDLTGSKASYKYDIHEDDLITLEYVVRPHQNSLLYSRDAASSLSGRYNEVLDKYLRLKEEAPESDEFKEISELYDLLPKIGSTARWSGKENIFVDVTRMLDNESIVPYIYQVSYVNVFREFRKSLAGYNYNTTDETLLFITTKAYSTPSINSISIERDLYNANDERMQARKYFVLGEDMLGASLGYEVVI